MNDGRDFKKEYDVFLSKVPYQTAVVDGVAVRYQYPKLRKTDIP